MRIFVALKGLHKISTHLSRGFKLLNIIDASDCGHIFLENLKSEINGLILNQEISKGL